MSLPTIHVYTGWYHDLADLLKIKLPNTKIIKIPITAPYTPYYPRPFQEDELKSLEGATIVIGDDPLLAHVVKRLPDLKWVQGTFAGVSNIIDMYKGIEFPSFPITRTVGTIKIQQMVEYVLCWILTHERKFIYVREQLNKENVDFAILKKEVCVYRTLGEITIGILGVGVIGKEIAKTFKLMGSKIIGMNRTIPSDEHKSPNVDKYYPVSKLDEFLAQVDYLINVLPSTPETRNIFGNSELKAATKQPVFINIGRKDIISGDDLTTALKQGWLGGAYLDFYDDCLKDNPKVIMTPHVAAVGNINDVVEEFVINYEKFVNGKPLTCQIDFTAGY